MRVPFLLVLLAATASAQAPAGLDGHWSGAAVYTDGALRLLDLEIAVQDGDLDVVLTQPYNGFTRFGVSFTYEPGRIDGELAAELFGDEMRLVADLDDGTLRGTVVIGQDTTATVSLSRVVDYPLPGYSVEEVSFQAGVDTLAAAILLPDGEGPFATVVLVPGRGYGSTRGDMASWGLLMARNGIAALAVDSRGTGSSTGVDSLVTGAERVEDLDAALDFLATHPSVRPDAVGVLSNSAGGWVTPLAIQDRDDVAFWMALVSPAGSLADQQAEGTLALMRRSGQSFTEAEVAAARAYHVDLVEKSIAGEPWSAIAPLVADARRQSWAEFADLPDSPTDEQPSYFRRRTDFDNTAALGRLTLPILAIYAGEDDIVPPDYHISALRAMLGSTDDLTVLVLPGADHSLGRPSGPVGDGAWPVGYQRVWGRSGVLFTTLVDWARQQAGL